jgi:hypothetical protein
MIDGGTECTGHDTKITMLIDLAERASDELAEAYAAVACAANIRAEQTARTPASGSTPTPA